MKRGTSRHHPTDAWRLGSERVAQAEHHAGARLEVTYMSEFTGIVHELRGHIGALRKPTTLGTPVEIAQ